MNDIKLIVAFAVLHLVALAAGGGLLLLALRLGLEHECSLEEGGWDGYRPPDPPRRPVGGPPLPVANVLRLHRSTRAARRRRQGRDHDATSRPTKGRRAGRRALDE